DNQTHSENSFKSLPKPPAIHHITILTCYNCTIRKCRALPNFLDVFVSFAGASAPAKDTKTSIITRAATGDPEKQQKSSQPLFFLASWTHLGRRLFHIKHRDLVVMMCMGSMMALSQTFYVAAIPSAGVSISTLIAICAAPVIIALVSTLVTRERLTPLTLFALAGAVGGTVLLVAARPHLNEGSVSFLGVFLAFLSACAYAGFILLK